MMTYRRVALGMLLAGSALSSPALAQSVTDNVPPERQNLDALFVDRVSGRPFVPEPVLQIGPEGRGGLAVRGTAGYVGNRSDNGGAPGGVGTNWGLVLYVDGNQYNVGLGQTTEKFTASSATSFTVTNATGGKLVRSGSTYTYTSSDGVVIVYGSDFKSSYETKPVARASSITYPTGEQVTLQWGKAQWCTNGQDSCVGKQAQQYQQTLVRLDLVQSSTGYQLRYGYAEGGVPYDNVGAKSFNRLTDITASNLAYCNPIEQSCSGQASQTPLVMRFSQSVDANNNYTMDITDPAGGHWKYVTNGSSLTVQRPTSGGANVTYFLSGGYVAGVTHDGVFERYEQSIDGSNRVIKVTVDPDGQKLVSTTVGDQSKFVMLSTSVVVNAGETDTTTSTYDGSGRLTQVEYPEHNKVVYEYDGRGNVTKTTAIPKYGDKLITTTASYPAGCDNALTCNQPTSTVDALGRRTDYTYKSFGAIETVTAPAVNGIRPVTTYAYSQGQATYRNASGNLALSGKGIWVLTSVSRCRTQASCTDGNEVRQSYGYGATDAPNNLLVALVATGSGADPSMTVTGYRYDPAGNVASIDGPRGNVDDVTYMRYDAMRRLTGIVSPDPDGSGPLKRRAQRIQYDADGKVIQVDQGTMTGAAEGDWQNFTSLLKVVTAYDGNGRKGMASSWGSDGATDAVTQYYYDGAGRAYCVAQRMNRAVFGALTMGCAQSANGAFGPDRITVTDFDGASRPVKVTQGVGTTTPRAYVRNFYTPNGKLSSFLQDNGNGTSYEYDEFDRLTRTRYPSVDGSDNETLGYDNAGRVTARTQRDGQVTTYGYDGADRLTNVYLPAGVTDNANRAFTYDLAGNMLTATTDGSGWSTAVTFTYDALGRKLTERSQLKGGADKTKTNSYDSAGNRWRLALPDAGLFFDYAYDATNALTGVNENGGGGLAAWSYDDLGRVTNRLFPNGTSQPQGFDAASHLASKGLAGGTKTTTYSLSQYSPAGQIGQRRVSNDGFAWGQSYAVTRGYQINGLNQYVTVGGNAVGYDRRGNLTSMGGTTYRYDSLNQLTAYTPPGGQEQRLVYDALGRLVYSVAEGVRFDYDGDDLVGEYNGNGEPLRRYLHGPGADEPLVRYEGNGYVKYYMDADERGSVVRVTDGNGKVVTINTYDPSGIPASTNAGRFQYTGQTWLAGLGMYYYKARMYSPQLGRFMQTDPIGYADGTNWYDYVGGDPVNGVDPTGTCVATRIGVASGSICRADGGGGGSGGSTGGGSAGGVKVIWTTTTTLNPDGTMSFASSWSGGSSFDAGNYGSFGGFSSGGNGPQNANDGPAGIGHNGPPVEAAAEGEIVVTAARITGTLVKAGGFFGSIIVPGPFDSLGPPSGAEGDMILRRSQGRLKTSTVDRSDEFKRLRATQEALRQADRMKNGDKQGWFGLVYQILKAITGS